MNDENVYFIRIGEEETGEGQDAVQQQYMITATTPEQHINNYIIEDVVIDGQHVVYLQGIVDISIAKDKCIACCC